MMDRQHGRLVWECDTCGDATFEGEQGEEFNEAWRRAKADGWKAKKIGAAWVHSCPTCEP